jgi:hypothetical protein
LRRDKTFQKKLIPMAAVVKAAWDKHAGRSTDFIDEALAKLYPQAPAKVIDAKITQAVEEGYVECGVTERSGWPTEKGLALL